MIPQFSNNAYASVFLWAQWLYLQYGQAYQTVTTPLYYTPDPQLPTSYVGYSSPFKSWVYDSGVAGATIIQNVSGGGFSAPLDRSSGIHIDYTNGRVILPSTYGTNLSLTGTFSMQEVNIYQPNESEEQILTQGKFYLNPRYNGQATGGIPPYVYATPAIFLNILHNENEAFALGGLIDCTTVFSLSVFAESAFQLEALLSIFRDCKYKDIPMLNTINDPLDGFGDTKGGAGYNYMDVVNTWGAPGNLIYIKDVKTAKVSDKVKMNPAYFVGLVDILVQLCQASSYQHQYFHLIFTMPAFVFQGADVLMSSGTNAGVYAYIDRVQDAKVDFQFPRADPHMLGQFKPANQLPIINYTPVNLTVNYTKSDKNVERNLGILNSTGLATLIGNGHCISDWGLRTYPIYIAPISTQLNAGEIDVVSGALKSFSLAGSLNDVVRGSFTVEALDLQQVPNGGSSVVPSYSGQVIRSKDVTITGIDFTGLGYSGLLIQSFNFDASFNYTPRIRLGEQYPTKIMTDGVASLRLSAFIQGTTNTITGLNIFSAGGYITGTYVFTLQSACSSTEPPTVITFTNPYSQSQAIGFQAANFLQADLSFSVPLTIVPYEATGYGFGPNVTIT